MPLLNGPPETVWGTGLAFFQTTVSPTRALIVPGENESGPIVTVTVLEPGAGGAPPPPPEGGGGVPPLPPGGGGFFPPPSGGGGGTLPPAPTTLTVAVMPLWKTHW